MLSGNSHPDQITQMIRIRGRFLVLDFSFCFTPFPPWEVPERQLVTSLTASASITVNWSEVFLFSVTSAGWVKVLSEGKHAWDQNEERNNRRIGSMAPGKLRIENNYKRSDRALLFLN